MELSKLTSTNLPVRYYDNKKRHDLSASEAFDIILNEVKPSGPWQYRTFFMAAFSGFFVGMHSMASALLSATPDFWCNATDIVNGSINLHDIRHHQYLPTCEYYEAEGGMSIHPLHNASSSITSNVSIIKCDSWIYDDNIYTSTTVSEWDLVCNDKWLNSAATSIFMAGVLAGGVIVSEMSDAYGRRRMSTISTALFIICSITTAFSMNYLFFVTFRFLTAFFAFGILIPNFIIGMETLGAEARASIGSLYHAPFGLGVCVFSGIGYLIRDWKYLQLAISLPMVILLLYFLYLPESPRWLLSQGRDAEAISILKQMAKVNGGRMPEGNEMDFLISRIVGEDEKTYNVFKMVIRFFKNQVKLVRTPIIRRRSLIMFFSWFVVSMVYYGLAFSASNINTSVYVLLFLSGASEFTSLVLLSRTLGRLGRRFMLCGSFVITGLSCLLILAVPIELVWVNVSLASIGKFFTSVTFAVGYIYSAEIVPTEIRNISVGTSSMYARLGSMIAPFIVDLLGEVHYAIPSTVFGILSLIAAGLTLLLPETGNQKLPETIEEIEREKR